MTVPNFDFLAPKDATNVVNSQVAKPFIDPTPIEKARWELAHKGITETQRQLGYKGLISDAMYQNVDPYGYEHHGLQILKGLKQAIQSQAIPDTVPDRSKEDLKSRTVGYLDRRGAREDAWRLYLGLPQKHDTFDISAFKPENSQDQKPYFSLKQTRIAFSDTFVIKNILATLDDAKTNKIVSQDAFPNVMGYYTLSKGKDKAGLYISYYDKWDLDKSGAELAGHPYEIYDRVYYDPKTYKPIPEVQVLAKLKATK